MAYSYSQVVRYLRENLTDKNVLLVLQHICLYCSSAAGRSSGHEWASLDEAPPITVGPTKLCRSISMYDAAVAAAGSDPAGTTPTPSAPPLPTISENEEEEPLLEEDCSILEDDQREFEAGMAVSCTTKSGRKVNCCDQLLKQCLELIDREASVVLASEDVEDLDISALNMIVCRDTLRLHKGELEVYNALKRWSTRECKRQRLELTSENRRRVLEGAQYLVRYLIISKEDFKADPYVSGILTSEEAEAVLTHLSGAINDVSVDLPDHLLYWQSIWKKPRRGRGEKSFVSSGRNRSITSWNTSVKRGSISSLRRGSVTPSIKETPMGAGPAPSVGFGGTRDYKPEGTHHHHHRYGKEKFNFIEEFFICLACIFD